MIFILGYIAGLITATLIVSTLIYFRRAIEHKVSVIEKHIESTGPKPKGFLIDPINEAEEARQAIIKKNQAAGRETKLSDLYE